MALVPDLIFQVASDLLDCVADALAEAGIEVPTRQYVHQGEVALDCCDQLVVTLAGLTHVMPGSGEAPAVCAPARSVQLDVWLTRCVPAPKENGDPPDPADLTDSAEQLQTDAFSLSYVLWSTFQAGCWGGGCASVLFGPVVPYGPEGECGGSRASVFINLTGIGATVASS